MTTMPTTAATTDSPVDTAATAAPRPPRQRNPRGQGYRLRGEIIDGATRLLERTGNEEALTLRAICREVGITVPSLQRVFPDRPAIIDAVVAGELATLHEALRVAADAAPDPAERLLALCRTYAHYAHTNPAKYAVLMGRRYLSEWETGQLPMPETDPLLAATIALLADTLQACIDTGVSACTDAAADTLLLWTAVHGLVSARAAVTSITWPDPDRMLTQTITRTARLGPAAPKG